MEMTGQVFERNLRAADGEIHRNHGFVSCKWRRHLVSNITEKLLDGKMCFVLISSRKSFSSCSTIIHAHAQMKRSSQVNTRQKYSLRSYQY